MSLGGYKSSPGRKAGAVTKHYLDIGAVVDEELLLKKGEDGRKSPIDIEAPQALALLWSTAQADLIAAISKLISYAKMSFFSIGAEDILKLKDIVTNSSEPDDPVYPLVIELLMNLFSFPDPVSSTLVASGILGLFIENIQEPMCVLGLAKFAAQSSSNRDEIIGFGVISSMNATLIQTNAAFSSLNALPKLAVSMFSYPIVKPEHSPQVTEFVDHLYRLRSLLSPEAKATLVKAASIMLESDASSPAFIKGLGIIEESLDATEDNTSLYSASLLIYQFAYLSQDTSSYLIKMNAWHFVMAGIRSGYAAASYRCVKIAELFIRADIGSAFSSGFFAFIIETFDASSYETKIELESLAAMIASSGDSTAMRSCCQSEEFFRVLWERQPKIDDRNFTILVKALRDLDDFAKVIGIEQFSHFFEDKEFQLWVDSIVSEEVFGSPFPESELNELYGILKGFQRTIRRPSL